MENVMFKELTEDELMTTDGGSMTAGALVCIAIIVAGVVIGFVWALCS